MTTIRLHGQLRQFGKSFRLAVKSPAEAIKALCIQIPGFERFLSNAKSRELEFAVFRDKRNIGEKELSYNGAGDIRIAPVVVGSKRGGVLQTIVGAILIVVGVIFSATPFGTPLIGAGIGLVAGGVIQMLSPQAGGLKTSAAPENTPGYLARVRSVSAFEISSIWKSSNLTNLEGKVSLPPTVSFLTATSELFGIALKVGFPPGAEDTQRTEYWYGPANDLALATKLADLAYPQADYRMQQLQAGATLFVWARLVDRAGNVGPFYPDGNGVMGQASSNADPVLELLTGKVTKTELGKDLLDELDGLQDQIDSLDGLKGYDPEATYLKGEMVVEGGRIYQAFVDVPVGTPPPNGAFWLDVGQSVETANGLAQQVATNTADITELDGVVTAQASMTNALRASARDDSGSGAKVDALKGWASTAAIVEERKARTTAIEAEATKTTKLKATVGQNTSAIQQTSSALDDTNGHPRSKN